MQISTVSTSPATLSMRGSSGKVASRIDTKGFLLHHDPGVSEEMAPLPAISIRDYQNQLRTQGDQEQAFVVSKGGKTVASIGQDGSAMFQDPAVAKIWEDVDGDLEAFASALEKAGYTATSYEPGSGPTYAEIHQQIHGESYETLIERQTTAFLKEMALSTGQGSFFSTVA